jgi:hypothetical protein
MDQIVVGLFGCVVRMMKNRSNARFAIASEFNGACVYVMECCNGVCDCNNSEDST